MDKEILSTTTKIQIGTAVISTLTDPFMFSLLMTGLLFPEIEAALNEKIVNRSNNNLSTTNNDAYDFLQEKIGGVKRIEGQPRNDRSLLVAVLRKGICEGGCNA